MFCSSSQIWACAIVLLTAGLQTAAVASPSELLKLPTGSNYIYVYDMPQRFTQDILAMPRDTESESWTQWYDLDQHIHRFLRDSPAAASEPEEARLYFIPVYLGRLYHSLLIEGQQPHSDCLRLVKERVLEALQHVKQKSPYWNRNNGRDHFMVFPNDHGRCHALAGSLQDDIGEMFAIQTTGDLALTDWETRSWFCYRPRRDIVVPVPIETQMRQLSVPLNPLTRSRTISVLYRFSGGGPPGTATFRTDPHNYSRTDLRTSLLQQHLANPIPGAVAGAASLEQTHLDMKQAVFCVCPSGISQHTLRVYRAILAGCIPVTFFRAFDNPLERNLGLDWSAFSVNINPDEHMLTQAILSNLLAKTSMIRKMQSELQAVQPLFEWHSGRTDGVEHNMLRELHLLLDKSPVYA